MDDLNSMLNSILGDPNKIEQLRQVAQSIGLSPNGASAPPSQPGGTNAAPGGFNPSAIASLLQNLQGAGGNSGGGTTPPASGPSGGNNGGFDVSAIASLLQNLQGGGAGGAPASGGNSGGGFDPSLLTSLLGVLGGNGAGQNAGAASGGGMPDLGTISKLAGVLGTLNQPDKNIDLLQALKPHFSAERAGKIDGAVRLMRLMHAWPAVRDSGLLGNLGNLFSGGGKR